MLRKAFTLVELLVVIAIISLLISILAPSLNIAKDIAKQVVCSMNLGSAGKSIHLYCNANDDKYPPYQSLTKSSKPTAYYMPQPEKVFWLTKVGDLDPVTLVQRWRGVGMVYRDRYIESPDYFYCHAQVYPWFVRSSYTDPTGQNAYGSYSTVTNYVRTGYLWNMWGAKYAAPDPGGSGNYDNAFRSLSAMDSDKALGMDHCIFPWTYQVHLAGGQDRPTFNVMYSDAHVEPITPAQVYTDNLLTNDWGGVLKNWMDYPGDNNDWAENWGILTGT